MPKIPTVIACALALLAVAPSGASAKGVVGYGYKVVKATHSSSASEQNGSFYGYTGQTSETWSLRKKSKDVSNTGDLALGNGGIVQFNIRGTYKDDVQTTFSGRNNSCSLTAPTGSTEFPAVAPDVAQVSFIQKRPNGPAQVGFAFPMASLENPYFGTECSHPDTVFPDDEMFIGTASIKTLRKKRFTLVNSGTPGGKYGNYTWRTAVTLQRVKTYR